MALTVRQGAAPVGARGTVPARLGRIAVAIALTSLVLAWSGVLIARLLGELAMPLPLLLVVPGGLTTVVLVRRSERGQALGRAAALTAVPSAAVLAAILVTREPLIGLAVPLVAVCAAVAAKRPAVMVIATFALTGTYGSLAAFTSIPTGETVDVLLAALWLSVAWGYLLHGDRRPLWVWPGIALLVLYLIVTMLGIFTTESTSSALLSFRASTWYVAAFLLVAFAPWDRKTRMRIAKGVVAVGLIAGAYACLRLVLGPTDAEVTAALSGPNPDRESNLGLLGSFPDRKRLAAWCATLIPFAAAFALIARGTWRGLAVAAAGTCAIALFATEARFATVAMAGGVFVLMALYQLSRAFPGLHVGKTTAVAGAAAVIGVGAFAITAGQSETSAERYTQVFTPTEAPSYNKRIERWGDALDVMATKPLGSGIGTVGRVGQERGIIEDLDLEPNLDSSYLKIGVEQGPVVMVLFATAMLLILAGLAARTIRARDAHRAALGMGSAGALAALCILFLGGFYSEGLTALAGWMIAGLGASQFLHRGPVASRRDEGVETASPRTGGSERPGCERPAREAPQPVHVSAQ